VVVAEVVVEITALEVVLVDIENLQGQQLVIQQVH
jgi:hypothetical protein